LINVDVSANGSVVEPANDGNFGVPENATLDCWGCHPGNQTPTKYPQGNQQSDGNTTTRRSYCQLATNAVNAVTAAATITNTYTYRMIVGTDFSNSGYGYSSCRQ